MKRFVVDFGGEEEMPEPPRGDLPDFMIYYGTYDAAIATCAVFGNMGIESWIAKIKVSSGAETGSDPRVYFATGVRKEDVSVINRQKYYADIRIGKIKYSSVPVEDWVEFIDIKRYEPVDPRLVKPAAGDEDWVVVAVRELAETENEPDDDFAIDNEHAEYFTVSHGNREWIVFRNQDEAETYAISLVEQDINDEPEIFNQDFIFSHISEGGWVEFAAEEAAHFCDDESDEDLIDQYGDRGDYDEAEEREDDEAMASMIDDARDSCYSSRTDSIVEEGVESYFTGVFGRDEGVREAIRILGIDVHAAAEDAVNQDGIAHFLAHYDGDEIELPGGAYAYRRD
jgi:hypothetical protein